MPRDPLAQEVTSLRTKNAKHYRNPNGTFSAEFSTGALHYRAQPSGPWLDKRQSFRAGPGTNEWISDESDVTMRTYQVGSGGNARWWVEFKETISGQGIAFQLQFQPSTVPGSNVLSFADGQGGTWTYTHTRSGGKMLGAATPASVGTRTYTFTYQLLGGAPPLTQNADGSISCGTIFRMAAPHLLGADGINYATSSWAVDAGAGTLSFTYSDASLPASAYPYRVDPSTSFSVAGGVDDQYVYQGSSSYPPGGSPAWDATATENIAQRLLASPTYFVSVGLQRWSTSIPAGSVITGATFRFYVTRTPENDNSRQLTLGWTAWDGSSATDYTDTAETDAHSGTSLSSFTANQQYDLALVNAATGVNPSGTTYLRTHVSGGQPTGINRIYYSTFERTDPEPILLVDYTAPGPVVRGSSSAGTAIGAAASTLVILKPTGLQVGDTMTMRVVCSGGTGATITPPTATGTWTLVSNGRTNSTTVLALAIYQKTAVQADVDATSYTITFDTNRKAAGSIAAHYNTAGIGQSSGQANASSTTVTAPSVTTTQDNELLQFIAATDSLSTFTAPTGMTERIDLLGHTPSGAAATRTYYLGNTTTDGYKNFLEAGSAAPTAGFMTTNPTGWIVGTTAAGNSSQFAPDVERLASTFSSNTTTPKPGSTLDTTLKDAFRTPSKLTGRIAAGAWDVAFLVRAQTSANAQAGRMNFRVWASPNADGSAAREITAAVQVCSTTAALTTTADATTSLATWNPGAVDLVDEYIFIQAAWEITTAGAGGSGSATRDVNLRVGSGARVITPSFQPAVSLAHEVADEARATAGATGTRAATATVAGVNIGHSLSLLPPATGATLTYTANDTNALADAIASLGVDRGLTDTNALADAYASTQGYVLTSSDVNALVDSYISAQGYVQTTTDGAALVDSTSRSYGSTATDGVAIADTYSSLIEQLIARTVTDTNALADSYAAALDYAQTATDTNALADSYTAALLYARTFTDAMAFVDSYATTQGYSLSYTDSVAIVDAALSVLGIQRTATDTNALVDSYAGALGYAQTFTDAIALVDAYLSVLGIQRTATDTNALVDSYTTTQAFVVSLLDTIAVVDGYSTQFAGAINRTVLDAVALVDTATPASTYIRLVNDVAALLDVATPAVAYIRLSTDAIAVGDSIAQRLLSRTFTDANAITDTHARLTNRLIADGLSSYTGLVPLGILAPSGGMVPAGYTDLGFIGGPIADNAITAQAFIRSVNDPNTLADSYSSDVSAALSRTFTDTVTLADLAAGVIGAALLRSVNEALGLTDSVLQSIQDISFTGQPVVLVTVKDKAGATHLAVATIRAELEVAQKSEAGLAVVRKPSTKETAFVVEKPKATFSA